MSNAFNLQTAILARNTVFSDSRTQNNSKGFIQTSKTGSCLHYCDNGILRVDSPSCSHTDVFQVPVRSDGSAKGHVKFCKWHARDWSVEEDHPHSRVWLAQRRASACRWDNSVELQYLQAGFHCPFLFRFVGLPSLLGWLGPNRIAFWSMFNSAIAWQWPMASTRNWLPVALTGLSHQRSGRRGWFNKNALLI